MKRRLLAIALLVSTGVAAQQPPVLPIRLHRGYLVVVKCSVGGLRDLTAIVDTGATETFVDGSVVARLGLATRPDTATLVAKQIPVRAVDLAEVVFGPVKVARVAGLAMDLRLVEREFGVRADVVLGMDVLGRSSFTIDYRDKVIRFGAPARMKYSAPLRSVAPLLLVEARVSGRQAVLQVDTGVDGLVMYSGSKPSQTGELKLAMSVLPTVLEEGRTLEVGDWKAYQVQVVRVQATDLGFDGLLGLKAVGARRLGLDFERGIIFWE